MNTKNLLGLILGTVCFTAYADISGTYDCDTTHLGKPSKGVVTIAQNDNNLSMTMEWDGKNKVLKDNLMATNEPNKFIDEWKGENSVGIALWEFGDNSLKITSTSLRIDNLNKTEEVSTCVKKQ
jgi:hypothetical protein